MSDFDGDTRTEAQWIGDIGWTALKRLADLRRELSSLDHQLQHLHRWAHENGLDDLAQQLCDAGAGASHAAAVLPGDAAVRLVIAATGREKQPYHA